jgi:hypothetical protein
MAVPPGADGLDDADGVLGLVHADDGDGAPVENAIGDGLAAWTRWHGGGGSGLGRRDDGGLGSLRRCLGDCSGWDHRPRPADRRTRIRRGRPPSAVRGRRGKTADPCSGGSFLEIGLAHPQRCLYRAGGIP